MGHCGSTDMAVIGVYHYLWCSLRRSLDRTSSGRMRVAATSASHRDGIDNASTSSRMRAVSSASGLMRIGGRLRCMGRGDVESRNKRLPEQL